MKQTLFMLLAVQGIFAQQNEWENPAIIDRNKLRGHTEFIVYNSEEAAKAQKPEASANYQSLNGQWKFSIVKTRRL